MGHVAQYSYSLRGGRMCAGEVGELRLAFFLEGICDVHGSGDFVDGSELGGSVAGDFFERAGKTFGITGESGGAGIGEVFTLSGEGKIEQVCQDGCEDGDDDGNDQQDELGLAATS